ncbi:MAG: UDP-N-acetylmuramate dehydrogenase [Chitinophagaceae bacterium]|nr:UDP-N-acetylmuramate dehydrogenase [Chitinophagaceae bacterium]
MKVLENISLKPYNTFGIEVLARYFSSFSDLDQLTMCVTDYARTKKVILGMGSNILFTGDLDGIILKNEIMGIEKIREDDEFVYLRAGAGENWHQFVLYCLEHDWAGVENLSLIPGTVGAAPMQNIGAYGVELEEVFDSLDAFHIHDRTIKTFGRNECEFGYRKSVFKNRFKDRFVILNVTFRLRKKPVFNISYGAIQQELEKMKVKELSIRSVSQAVIRIRSSKLPDPAVIGNAGSFFKNPEVTREQFEELRVHYPEVPHYPVKQYNVDEDTKDKVKLAAGWLIEQCGWKGFRRGDAGVHDRQSLVLVNYGHASGNEIYYLSEEILQSVYQKFSIMLEREVNII